VANSPVGIGWHPERELGRTELHRFAELVGDSHVWCPSEEKRKEKKREKKRSKTEGYVAVATGAAVRLSA
jgi:hypothetical protein